MSGRISVSPKSERTIDGITFASKAEMRRWFDLRMLERAGVIKNLRRQPAFVLQDAFIHPIHGRQQAIKYVADFEYETGGKHIVEDCKGHQTEIYRLKKKLLLAKYPDINFREEKA